MNPSPIRSQMDPCASHKVGWRLTGIVTTGHRHQHKTHKHCRAQHASSRQGPSHAQAGQAVPGWKRPGLLSAASLCPKIFHLLTEGEKNQVRQVEAQKGKKGP